MKDKKKAVAGRKTSTVGIGMLSKRRPSFRGNIYSPPLGHEIENEKMNQAEKEQTRVDKFWGLDAQAANCARECMLMAFEDYFSRSNENMYESLKRQARWELEYQQEQYHNAYIGALQELDNRKKYMKSLFAAESTEDIIKFRWKNQVVVAPKVLSKSLSTKSMAPTLDVSKSTSVLLQSDFPVRSPSMHLDGLQQGRAVTSELHKEFLGPVLRNRNIQDVVEESLTTASILKPAKGPSQHQHHDHHGSSTRASSPGGGTSRVGTGSGSPGKKRPKSPLHQLTIHSELSTLPLDDLLKTMCALKPRHNDALEGHEHFKWDQDGILRHVFHKLDVKKRDIVLAEELGSIASNQSLQYFLQFTVFASWVKKKKWRKFISLCDPIDPTALRSARKTTKSLSSKSGKDGGGGGSSVATFVPKGVTLESWLAAAMRYSREFSVPRIHIRTEEEHKALCSSYSPTHPPPRPTAGMQAAADQIRRHRHQHHHHHHRSHDNSTAEPGKDELGWFADLARTAINIQPRNFMISRDLQEGDVVWALHGKGTIWLPALIEKVLTREPISGRMPAFSTGNKSQMSLVTRETFYDLSYFMSYSALCAARSKVAARKLLGTPGFGQGNDDVSLSSQDVFGAGQVGGGTGVVGEVGNIGSIYARAESEEREICARVFIEVCRKLGFDDTGPNRVNVDSSSLLSCLRNDVSLTSAIRASAALSAMLLVWPQVVDSSASNSPVDPLDQNPATASSPRPSSLSLLSLSFLQTFPSTVNRDEFLEFCVIALEVLSFNSVLGRV